MTRPDFTTLDALAAIPATLADVGAIATGLDGAELKHYRVALGDDAEERPGIVWPVNRHATLNPVLFLQC